MNESEMGYKSSSSKQETEPLTWRFWRKRRYIVVLLSFLGFLSSLSLRVNLNVAIVAMDDEYFTWSSLEKGLIFSSFFWGYIMTTFVGGLFAKRFGGNVIFGLGIGLTAILALLTPWLGRTVLSMIVIRVMQGLFSGVTFPCINEIWLYWSPISERSRMASMAYSGMFIGIVITMPTSAYIATTLGWESIFYIFSGFGILWHIVWMLVVRSSPDKDPYISDDELQYIQSTVDVEKYDKRVIPWKALLTSKPVYAIAVAEFSLHWGYNTMITQMPTFFADTLHYDLGSSGFLSSAPALAMGLSVFVAGYLADMLINRRILTITQARKFFYCGGSILQAICMSLAGFLVHPVWSTILIVIGIGVGGFSTCGYSVNALDLAPDFASIILGFSTTFASLTGVFSPVITGTIVEHKTLDEWQIIFYISAGLHLVGTIIYWTWCSGELQPWSQTTNTKTDNKETANNSS